MVYEVDGDTRNAPVALNYRVLGEQGDWVLLLHGLFGSGDNLGALAKSLMADFRTVQVDLRNHGRSPHCESMNFAAMAADIALLQDTLGISSSHVVGHSLGGRVAMQLALSQPSRVQRLVIADIAPVQYPPHHVNILNALRSLKFDGVVNRAEVEAQLLPSIADLGTRQFLLKSLYKDGDDWRWRFNLPVLEASYPSITQAQQGKPFTKPTLFIKGGASAYIQPQHEEAMRALFPNFALKTIAGAGHWLHGEKPAEFNALVREFLTAEFN
ncbi:MAG: alpha/beta fold hydrolase [Spongiibacteraceae bacterium]